MRRIEAEVIEERVARACIEANRRPAEGVVQALEAAREQEEAANAREILGLILENIEAAEKEGLPLCQDTGLVVVLVELGSRVKVKGRGLEESINAGIKRGYERGYLRKSIVDDPLFERRNTGDNVPAVIHTRIVDGEGLRIVLAPKGGGSENMSRLEMLKPAAGVAGVREFVLETVRLAGPNACPPLVVGVGIGGNFEGAAWLAKKALLRSTGSSHADARYADLERELLEAINGLGIGPQGLGGKTTALAVHIETHPCHIASLPVAVNLNCHATRHVEMEL